MKATSVIAALAVFFGAASSFAQNYPEQTVRILVGFSPGVAPDVTARLLAERLAAALVKPRFQRLQGHALLPRRCE